jgi:hypothetical protein
VGSRSTAISDLVSLERAFEVTFKSSDADQDSMDSLRFRFASDAVCAAYDHTDPCCLVILTDVTTSAGVRIEDATCHGCCEQLSRVETIVGTSPLRCPSCGALVVQRTGRGRPCQYCSGVPPRTPRSEG